MPYFWRPYRTRYRRRYRRHWRRRPRSFIRRRRFWRRKRYRVRKKLKKITIQQWQPSTIKKLTIRGQYPLYAGTTERIGNDYISYIDSVAPDRFPGGGLFSIIIFSLNGLYELHQKARNWWTTSNCNLPLIRYHGCTIKLYASSSSDYVTVPVNCGDLKATEQTFQSCQPSVLYLNKRKKVMLCKNFKRGKTYKKIYIKPPALFLNKWYFQKDIANYPLLMLLTSAASFDRYYMPASAISETIGFESLNTTYFQKNGFKTTSTTFYTPNDEFILMGIQSTHLTWETATLQNCVVLGNTKDFQQGTPLGQNNWENYLSTPKSQGNPFHPYWFGSDIEDGVIFHIKIKDNNPRQTILSYSSKKTTTLNQLEGAAKLTKPLKIHCRYNPQPDMGHNAIFLSKITEYNTKWHEPQDHNIIQQGYPLWLIYYGWHDYLVKAKVAQNIDTDYANVIVSDYITHSPKQNNLTYYVPLDWFMLDGRSPYGQEKGDIKTYDFFNWHPKCNFQTQTISHIIETGPATVKLPPMISTEAHMTYKFHFKVGGCPPAMDEVCNPAAQPSYPQPSNFFSSILLQNPEYPIQYYLNSFDQRRDIITERAAKRFKEDTTAKESFFKPTGQTLLQVQAKDPQETSEESTTEEESEETLQQHLNRHRRRQRKLQYRILNLLAKLENTI